MAGLDRPGASVCLGTCFFYQQLIVYNQIPAVLLEPVVLILQGLGLFHCLATITLALPLLGLKTTFLSSPVRQNKKIKF